MSNLSGFETQSDVELRRQKRQEEWEKVRKAEDPEVAPDEEPYDGRSLYERLKSQKDAKDLEFEESRKFKNMIRGLDDDDVGHLNEIDNKKLLEEKKLKEDELKELSDYRAKVAELQEQSAEQKLSILAPSKGKSNSTSLSRTSSQKAILSSVVKRKSQMTTHEPPQKRTLVQPSALKCLAVLPGIGDYKSSDSDASSDELEEMVSGKTDLTGRQIRKKKECDE